MYGLNRLSLWCFVFYFVIISEMYVLSDNVQLIIHICQLTRNLDRYVVTILTQNEMIYYIDMNSL